MYDLVRGPMVWVALIVFGFGLVIQGIRFFRLTGEKERRVGLALPRKKKSKKKKKSPWLEWWSAWFSARYDKWLRFYRGSIIQTHPVMILVTIVFHGLLFVIPLFLLAHNLLIAKSLGVSLCSFSESVSHFLTVVFLFCVVFFLSFWIFWTIFMSNSFITSSANCLPLAALT